MEEQASALNVNSISAVRQVVEPAFPMYMDPHEPVSRIMSRDVFRVYPNDKLHKAAYLMRAFHVSGLPVVDKTDHVVGIISEVDLLRDLHHSTGVLSAHGGFSTCCSIRDRNADRACFSPVGGASRMPGSASGCPGRSSPSTKTPPSASRYTFSINIT